MKTFGPYKLLTMPNYMALARGIESFEEFIEYLETNYFGEYTVEMAKKAFS